jgi:acid phosphatase
MAGNIESHSELSANEGILNITAVLNTTQYGYNKLTVFNASAIRFQFILGTDGSVADELVLLKPTSSNSSVST